MDLFEHRDGAAYPTELTKLFLSADERRDDRRNEYRTRLPSLLQCELHKYSWVWWVLRPERGLSPGSGSFFRHRSVFLHAAERWFWQPTERCDMGQWDAIRSSGPGDLHISELELTAIG